MPTHPSPASTRHRWPEESSPVLVLEDVGEDAAQDASAVQDHLLLPLCGAPGLCTLHQLLHSLTTRETWILLNHFLIMRFGTTKTKDNIMHIILLLVLSWYITNYVVSPHQSKMCFSSWSYSWMFELHCVYSCVQSLTPSADSLHFLCAYWILILGRLWQYLCHHRSFRPIQVQYSASHKCDVETQSIQCTNTENAL